MDQLTALIKQEIKKQFKSVRKFTSFLGIPYTTIASALKNGVGGTSYETVAKICKALDISLVNYQNPVLINEDSIGILRRYNLLDEQGAHTVRTVLEIESARCAGTPFSSDFINKGID